MVIMTKDGWQEISNLEPFIPATINLKVIADTVQQEPQNRMDMNMFRRAARHGAS